MLPAGLLQVLREYWRAARPTDCFFPSRSRQGHISRVAVYQACRRAADEAGITKRVHLTRCATVSPPTCWRAARTCGRSRCCWAMQRRHHGPLHARFAGHGARDDQPARFAAQLEQAG